MELLSFRTWKPDQKRWAQAVLCRDRAILGWCSNCKNLSPAGTHGVTWPNEFRVGKHSKEFRLRLMVYDLLHKSIPDPWVELAEYDRAKLADGGYDQYEYATEIPPGEEHLWEEVPSAAIPKAEEVQSSPATGQDSH